MSAGCIRSAPQLGVVLGGISVQPSGTALVLFSKKRGEGAKGDTVQHLGRWEGRKKSLEGKTWGRERGKKCKENGQLQIEAAENKL